MRKIIFILLLGVFGLPISLRAQITNVIVETYYVSDANDATDSTNYYVDSTYAMPVLPAGSKTYRVYIELVPGSRLMKIYGDANHALKIVSTENFFNNIDRGQRFGKDIDNTKLKKNTVALDTWLTLGKATKKHSGILKAHDANGTVLHPGNDGGTAGAAELLLNNDAAAGIPLTVEDGLIHDSLLVDTVTVGSWVENGFTDTINSATVDTTIFGESVAGSEFISNDAFLSVNTGVIAPTASDNNILVAQLTTHGELTFELNAVVREPHGANSTDVYYVAKFAPGESSNDTLQIAPFLKYPPVCGCTDPHYVEFSSAYSCNNPDSCRTRIKFGCMDVMACNYDPTANFNVPELCCYPGRCNDRDIAFICPAVAEKQIHLYPNPAQNEISLQVTSDATEDALCRIFDSQGKLMLEKNIFLSSGASLLHLDVSELPKGVYMLRVFMKNDSIGKTFFKN